MRWLKRLFGKADREVTIEEAVNERVLSLEREVQSLKLELEERNKSLEKAKGDMERQRSGERERVDESVRSQLESILTNVATPIAQLMAQAHLLEVESKPVQAKDVLAVAKRLIRAMEDAGLEMEGAAGEAVDFDPNRHEILNASATPKPGEKVVVRFTGISYRGKLLRKASVEKVRT
jgi:molecular chaperone GrpE (heat shock protein)